MACLLALVGVALSSPQPYHFDDSLWTAELASRLRSRPSLSAIPGSCDQPRARFELSGTRASGSLRGRNVLLFIGESWGVAATSLGDPPRSTTPFLKELSARHGLGGGAMRAQSSFSTKAIYSLLTGRYASAGMQAAESYQARIPSLASVLRQAGFATAFFSAQWLDWQNTRHQYQSMGFERVEAAHELQQRALTREKLLAQNSYGIDDAALLNGLVDSLPRDRPFFAVFYSVNTHVPYFAPGDKAGYDPSEAHFERALRYSDEVLRKLVAQLEAAQLTERTLLIVAGDHGENFERGSFRSRSCLMTEAELNAALLLAAPGVPTEAKPELHMLGARQIDLVPTVLDLLGISSDLQVQGRSLLNPGPPQPAYLDSYGTCDVSGVVTASSKLLYDLGSDRLFKLAVSGAPASPARELFGPQKRDSVRRLLACRRYNIEGVPGADQQGL